MKLYYHPGNASLAPHMVLEEAGAAFEAVYVDQPKGEHKTPAYLKMNPNGLVPTFVDGDLILFESAAICLHVADAFPDARLLPPVGTAARGQCYKWLIHLTNTLQAMMSNYFHADQIVEDEAMRAAVKAGAERQVGVIIDRIEAQLAATPGPFFLGADVSIADHYMLMLARWSRGMARPAKTRPAIHRLCTAVSARPAVRRVFAREGLAEPFI